MKKVATILIMLASCNPSNVDKIYYTKNIKKCIKNLEVMEKWIEQDYDRGDIPYWIGQNYLLNVSHTKESLNKKYKKYIINDK